MFKNGRELSAWLGLVPRQHSTGGRARLLGISKRGDRYIRCLLIHGARAALLQAGRHQDRRSRWVKAVEERRGKNVAAVALANKNARVAWTVLAKGTDFDREACGESSVKGMVVTRWERLGHRRVKTLRVSSADAPALSGDPPVPQAYGLARAGPAGHRTTF